MSLGNALSIELQDDADLLFSWMSHLGEGGQVQLRRRVDALLFDMEPEVRARYRATFRRRLYELGHTDTLETHRWRIAQPYFALLDCGQEAVWVGGRVPTEEGRLATAAAACNCHVTRERLSWAPARVALQGDADAILQTVQAVGLPVRQQVAQGNCRDITPLARRLREEILVEPPTEAVFEAYDYTTGEWTPEAERRHVLRRRKRTDLFDYYVLTPRGWLQADGPPSAIFLGACNNQIALCHYDAMAQRFTTRTLLPKEFSRPLCLCSGRLPASNGAERIYANVPPHIAAAVLTTLGQPPPDDKALDRRERRTMVHWIR